MTDYRNRHRTRADLTLGHYLATARVARGYTQTEAAEEMCALTGVKWTQVTISNIERGRTPCTVVQYIQLARLYGVDVPGLPINRGEAYIPCQSLPDDRMERPRLTS